MNIVTSLDAKIRNAVHILNTKREWDATWLKRGSSPTPPGPTPPVPPTPTMWTVTFANAVNPPVEGITMPAAVEIENEQLLDGSLYSPSPASGEGWEFKCWSINGVEADRFQITSDTTLVAVYQSTSLPAQDPQPTIGASQGSTAGTTNVIVTGMVGATVSITVNGQGEPIVLTIGQDGSVNTDIAVSEGDLIDVVVSISGYEDEFGSLTITSDVICPDDPEPTPDPPVSSHINSLYVSHTPQQNCFGHVYADIPFDLTVDTNVGFVVNVTATYNQSENRYEASWTGLRAAVGDTVTVTVESTGYTTFVRNMRVSGT